MEMNRENYREYDAINFSKLGQLDRNPSKVDEEKDWHDGMAFGSLVDLMCFEPDEVEEKFYVNNADREPSSTAKELADWIVENKDDLLVDANDEIKQLKSSTVGTSRNEEYSLSSLLTDAVDAIGSSTDFDRYGGIEYLKAQIESKDKNVVSPELYENAKRAHRTLKSHEFTRKYFRNPDRNVEIQFQVPILWDPSYYDDELKWMAKSLLDIVIFDHEEKTVKPVDLKTTSSSVFMFEQKMTKWRYYLQAAYYYDGLSWRIKNHDEVDDYEMLPFEFVVISSKNLHNPLVYQTTENDLSVGRNGGKLSYNDRKVRGWIQLIKDLKWHERNNKWDYPREVYESNGKVELDIFN
jgi:hypothetical protein